MELSPHARKQEEMAIDFGGRKQQSNTESGQVVIHRTYTAHSTSVLCFQQWRQQVEYVVIHVAAKEARWRGLCDQMCHEKDAKNHSVDTNATFYHPHLWIVACWNLGVLLSRPPLALNSSLLHSDSPSSSGQGYHN